MINESKLNLACGNHRLEGFKGIDIASLDTVDYVMDLQKYPWDIESNSVDEVYCSHYIEHIPHSNVASDLAVVLEKSNSFEEFKENIMKPEFQHPGDGLIRFVNELYRILKPGGKATIIAPYYSSMRSFGDPTHKRYICDFTVSYFNKEARESMGLGHYGIECDFDAKMSYAVSEEVSLKSEEVRHELFTKDLNVIDDILIELTKR